MYGTIIGAIYYSSYYSSMRNVKDFLLVSHLPFAHCVIPAAIWVISPFSVDGLLLFYFAVNVSVFT